MPSPVSEDESKTRIPGRTLSILRRAAAAKVEVGRVFNIHLDMIATSELLEDGRILQRLVFTLRRRE